MSQQVKVRNGKLGELLVEVELVKRGWHVERLDGAASTINGDLIAIKHNARAVIQVKSAMSGNRPSFGHATKYLQGNGTFFNRDNPTIRADALVTVCGSVGSPKFHVFRIEHAEELAKSAADAWYEQKTREGKTRSKNFPVSFSLSHDEICRARNNWDILENITV